MPSKHAGCAALLLFALLSSEAMAQPAARLAISPDRYEVEFESGGGETQSLMVKNLTQRDLTVQLSVGNWELDENNQVVEIAPQEDSLDQWIVINPLRVTIPANTPQTVRWAILPRQAPEQGEYRAVIFIEEVLNENDPGSATSVRMKLRYGIPVYAQFGEPKVQAEILNVAANDSQPNIALELRNAGNRHARLRGVYGVWPKAEFPGTEAALRLLESSQTDTQVKMQEVVLLPGNTRTVQVSPELPGVGEYIVQFDASFGDTPLRNTITLGQMD